jgi:eukaryotic-like serine/threonine-protein kinase
MSSERWKRIEEIFMEAVEQPPVRRSAFLEAACSGDASLRAEVESLLHHEIAAEADLRAAVADAASSLPPSLAGSEIGTAIGPYQIVREIGRGGMGTVYLAVRVDEQYLQTVAIKLVRKGMDSEFILSRFRHERQILANLNHSNIAAMLDGGTTDDGRPYFVMEYIEGQPILDYCRDRALSLHEKLDLFRAICSAVHHAHQKLVIHRDLKPGNILVTSDGVPKLLDFGIAKLLVPELFPGGEPATATTFRLMTPDYASPEQVRGEALTTATDIYSLGATLFELLTEKRPFRTVEKGTLEVQQAILRDDPPKPSSVVDSSTRRLIAGDLDNIVLMAMRKEPNRRYASVEQLADDIRRFQQDLPVFARKDTVTYRLSKVVRRNRAASVISLFLVVTLIAGLASTLWQARLAERRFNELRKLSNSFLFEFHDAIQDLPGSTPARALVVRKALEYFDTLARDSGSDESLLAELAAAYQRVGDVQGSQFQSNLGDTAGAMKSYSKALEIRKRLHESNRTDRRRRFELAITQRSIGDMQWQTGDLAGSLKTYREVRGVLEELQRDNNTREIEQALAETHHRIGDAEANLNDSTRALATYGKAHGIYEGWTKSEPTNKIARRGLSMSQLRVAHILGRQGKGKEALGYLHQALELRKVLLSEDATSLTARRDLMTVYNRIGDLKGNPYTENLGDKKGAEEAYRESVAIARDIAQRDPSNARAFYDLAITYMRLGDLLKDTGTRTERLRTYQAGKEISEAALKADPRNNEVKYNLALLHTRIALVHKDAGESAAALVSMNEGLRVSEELAALPNANQRYLYQLGSLQGAIGELKLDRGDLVGARQAFEVHARMVEKVAAADPDVPKTQRSLADAYMHLAIVEARSGNCDGWKKYSAQAEAIRAKLRTAKVPDEDKEIVPRREQTAALCR